MANRVVEFRIFRLHHDLRAAYAARFEDHVLPLLNRHGIEVLAWGPSLHDRRSFYIMTAYASVEDRRERLNAMFGSDGWLVDQEETVMEMIETVDIGVVEATEPLIEAMRTGLVRAEEDSTPPGWR